MAVGSRSGGDVHQESRPGQTRLFIVECGQDVRQTFPVDDAKQPLAADAQAFEQAVGLQPVQVVGDSGLRQAETGAKRSGVEVGVGGQSPKDPTGSVLSQEGPEMTFAGRDTGHEVAGEPLHGLDVEQAVADEKMEVVLRRAEGQSKIARELAQVDAGMLGDVVDQAAPVGQRQEAALDPAGVPWCGGPGRVGAREVGHGKQASGARGTSGTDGRD
jgi:hypothetical protein